MGSGFRVRDGPGSGHRSWGLRLQGCVLRIYQDVYNYIEQPQVRTVSFAVGPVVVCSVNPKPPKFIGIVSSMMVLGDLYNCGI